ncbi:hypothetical protein [Arthrobacter sp. LFS091]|uniref:hypothetical protein n=1 Tax=Arthrobacter sp. LFS091 TaxID=3229892 RepID=UPI003A80D6C8
MQSRLDNWIKYFQTRPPKLHFLDTEHLWSEAKAPCTDVLVLSGYYAKRSRPDVVRDPRQLRLVRPKRQDRPAGPLGI